MKVLPNNIAPERLREIIWKFLVKAEYKDDVDALLYPLLTVEIEWIDKRIPEKRIRFSTTQYKNGPPYDFSSLAPYQFILLLEHKGGIYAIKFITFVGSLQNYLGILYPPSKYIFTEDLKLLVSDLNFLFNLTL